MWYTYPWKRRLTYLLRAYKYRIYPNEVQRVFFAKTFGCVRFVYNKMLHDRQLAYQAFQEDGVKPKPK
ncbi:helix-turn-helix domain-containing protein, partial [Paenibacillus alkaliterrae]|uniref:helix-turn-helix domain-containing protein n=1 Tax=Paenibacillus alkaliterrae TaxID=320909 RepID=UPI0039F05BFC